jgi:succinoglycan biosynthesis protein ExoW
MKKLSVIIPYYQRKPGLLRTALDSIYAQVLSTDIAVEILVVDDESPNPPEHETRDYARPNFNIRIIKRRNGGPARARNSGLDAAAGSDFIAFLDSDDFWFPDHLETGLAALENGSQFFFSNNFYDDNLEWFSGFACTDKLLAAATEGPKDQFSISSEAVMPFFLEECLAHTSTVIYDARAIGDLRFDEAQERAGEDYLFWITATHASQRVAFSLRSTATRGRGLDLYRAALAWNSPDCIKRLYFALMLHKKLLARFCSTEAEKARMQGKIDLLRRGIIYLFIRNSAAHFRANMWVMGKLLSSDLAFWFDLPGNTITTVTQKLQGRLEFPLG